MLPCSIEIDHGNSMPLLVLYTGNNNESSYKVSSALDYLKIRLDDTSSVPATETDCDGDEQSVVSTPADASLLRLHSAHPTRK